MGVTIWIGNDNLTLQCEQTEFAKKTRATIESETHNWQPEWTNESHLGTKRSKKKVLFNISGLAVNRIDLVRKSASPRRPLRCLFIPRPRTGVHASQLTWKRSAIGKRGCALVSLLAASLWCLGEVFDLVVGRRFSKLDWSFGWSSNLIGGMSSNGLMRWPQRRAEISRWTHLVN